MTISELRRRVDALCRKYATELRIYRLRRLALEFCDEMAEAVQGPKPEKPRSITDWAKLLFDRAKERNVRLNTFVHLAELPGEVPGEAPSAPGERRPAQPPAPGGRERSDPSLRPDRPLPRRTSLHQ